MPDFVANLASITSVNPTDYFYILQVSQTVGLPDLDRKTTIEELFAGLPVDIPNTSLLPIRVQTLNANSSSLAIDLSLGQYVIVELNASVETLTITNWPGPNVVGVCTLDVRNQAHYGINWGSTKWANGNAPTLSPGPNSYDIFILHSPANGSPVFGTIFGQNYKLPV